MHSHTGPRLFGTNNTLPIYM